jgi:hypothetical protein
MASKKLSGIPAPVSKDTYETVRALVEVVNELVKLTERAFSEIEMLKKAQSGGS